MSSSSSVVGDDGFDLPPPRPKRTQTEVRIEGPLRILVVRASGASGLWDEVAGDLAAPQGWPGVGGPGDQVIVGFVLSTAWTFRGPDEDDPMDEALNFMHQASRRATRAHQHYGFIEYPIKACAALETPALAVAVTPLGIANELEGKIVRPERDGFGEGRCVKDLVSVWRQRGAVIGTIVEVGHRAAWNILAGQRPLVHCVALTGKTARNKLLVEREPSRVILKKFVAEVKVSRDRPAAAAPADQPSVKDNTGWHLRRHAPELVLAWLDASSFVKDVKRMGDAAKSFAQIFSRSMNMPPEKVLANLHMVHAEVIRRARVRLDCVAMLLFRRLWANAVETTEGQVSVYIFADASPQWRGLELYASSFDLYDGQALQRRMLPMVSLDKEFQDAVGKSLALLWQIFLMVGPSFHMVRLFCSRVKSITTDQGVERLLADFPNILPEFFSLVDPKFKVPDMPEDDECKWLFPKAMAVPGWMHMWDLLLRRGLSSMKWFPKWVLGLKSIVYFLRRSQDTTFVVRSLRQKGLPAVADMLENAHPPNFAEWRWGTLLLCCDALEPVVGSLSTHFDASLFANTKDRSGLSTMLGALKSKEWHVQFSFVHWFCRWLGGLMSWGKGCPCHEQALLASQVAECPNKGRRLKEAFLFATKELKRGLNEGNSWTAQTWGSSQENFWVDSQAVVRATFELGVRKTAFLDRLPYLLVRLGEAGVAQKCLHQWNSCAPAQHHRVSRAFMQPGGKLRAHIEAIAEDASGISSELQAEIDALANMPLDDSAAESPHAAAHRLMKHCRAAKWPWVAASMRLQQNLADAKAVPPVVNGSIAALWSSHSAVLRGPSARGGEKPLRITSQKLQADVYSMAFATEQVEQHAAVQVPAIEDLPEDPGDPSAVGTSGNARPGQASGSGRLNAEARRKLAQATAANNAGGDGASSIDLRKRNSEDVRLMRQFLAASLEVGNFISLPTVLEEGSPKDMFFQLLSLESRSIIVKTFTSSEEANEQGLFTVSVQPLDWWGGDRSAPLTTSSPPQEVFVFQEPCQVDILLLFESSPDRRSLLRWVPVVSDVDGCMCLQSPKVVAPSLSLSSPTIPVLSLLDALRGEGYEGVRQKVEHAPAQDERRYDCRDIVSKRFYLQCVLAESELLPNVLSFPSAEPAPFYQLLLKTKKYIAPGQGAKVYKQLLASDAGDLVELATLERGLADAIVPLPALEGAAVAARERPRPINDEGSSVIGDESSDAGDGVPDPVDPDEVVGDEVVWQEHLPEPPSLAPAPPAVAGPGAMVPAEDIFPERLLGQRLRKVAGRKGGGWNYHSRLSVTCGNALHTRCTKSRSTEIDAARFGPRAAMYFLGAWLHRSDLQEQEHRHYMPNLAAVEAFKASFDGQ